MTEVIPADSRYTPLQQQPYCCVPTCFQIVMLDHGLPLVPAELIGWHCGLTVPSEAAALFYNPRVSAVPPSSGYGTRLHESEFTADSAFAALGIPLRMTMETIDAFPHFEDFVARLVSLMAADADVLLCYQVAALTGEAERTWGHVCVLDRLDGESLRLIDPGHAAKWRVFSQRRIYDAMRVHGADNAAGLWILSRI